MNANTRERQQHGPSFTALTMVRGESDIIWSSLLHHARLGFHRLIVVSYLEHGFLRQCIDRLREAFPDLEVDLVEIESRGHFGRRKAFYVNRALTMFVDPKVANYVYCFDADEFLSLGRYTSVGDFLGAFLSQEASMPSGDIAADCFPMPWLNLIPKRRDFSPQDLSGQFLQDEYLCVDRRENSRHKVLFRKRINTRVHMAYHQTFLGEKDIPVQPHPRARDFVESTGACVYHVPLRSPSQFRDRLEGPMRRVLAQAANEESGAASEGVTRDFADQLFEACIASQPRYTSLAEATNDFGEAITDRKIRAITRFIYRRREDVGPVLGAAR
ncbi:glycosyltransferase family 2 protein [Salinicola avicenniae]|uniref:glycosyltransferase family 2 protein n=1 Tax=Salinicola avicenniae TaxID=2916836 RepID=UPI0020741AB8|nr:MULTISPECIES: glycosyltransferase family 2 protein [unclassified Salinicola]